MTKTMKVVVTVSLREGQVTRPTSCRTCRRNSTGVVFSMIFPSETALYSAHHGRKPDTSSGWQEWRGSNPQPPVLETGALPVELHSYQRLVGEGHSPLRPSFPCDEELGSKGVHPAASTLCDGAPSAVLDGGH